MTGAVQRLAVYTTIYPGVEPYLLDWYRSLQGQTDQHFQLCIGLDGVRTEEIETLLGAHVDAIWVPSGPGSTPASIREQALEKIISDFYAVVLVDSDDILYPTRVAAARMVLQDCELAACALRLVDRNRKDLGLALTLPDAISADEILPRTNIFGFSNSAFRSSLLQKCLPIPHSAVLVDWFLATRAWLAGAKIHFDKTVHMEYRQYGANTAPISFPIDANRVARDTEKVLKHFQLLLAAPPSGVMPDRWELVRKAAGEVTRFHELVVARPVVLNDYVLKLNTLRPQAIWWWDVAHPALQSMWRNEILLPNESY